MTMGTQRYVTVELSRLQISASGTHGADTLLMSVSVASRGHRDWRLDLSCQNRCDAHDDT
jgi:hypothetical protein